MLGSVRGFRVPRTPLAILVGLSLVVPSVANGAVDRAGCPSETASGRRRPPAKAAAGASNKSGAGQRIGDFSAFLQPARR